VLVDPEGECLQRLRPEVVVDARMAKRGLDTRRGQAPLVVGLGPGFAAGGDVHAVVETQRGEELGRVLWSGSAQADTARPAPVLGVDSDRVLRAPRAGTFLGGCRIGALVPVNWRIGEVEGIPITARVGGLVRGLLHDGVAVDSGAKVGDIDPRGAEVDPARVSDKGRAVAAGVLEAVLTHFKGRF
jgi:xanthine dehydrogenase accessory factor